MDCGQGYRLVRGIKLLGRSERENEGVGGAMETKQKRGLKGLPLVADSALKARRFIDPNVRISLSICLSSKNEWRKTWVVEMLANAMFGFYSTRRVGRVL